MIRRKKLFLISLFCLLFWVSGVASANAAAQRLVITGSSTVAPLIGEIARRFESLHPDVRVDVQTGGSSRGINDVRRGIANIGMVSRALKPDESDLQAFPIALDGISLIVHAANPVTALSKQQIAAIYSGNISHWHGVGGTDARITVVNKAEGRSTLELFLAYLQLTNNVIKPHIIIGDNAQGIKTVTGNRNAIGYVSIGAAVYEAQRGMAVRLTGPVPAPANSTTITAADVLSREKKNGAYVLSISVPTTGVAAVDAQLRQVDAAHLHFFHCVSCHTFIPYHDCFVEDAVRSIEQKYQYTIHRHVLYFTGLCGTCRAEQSGEVAP